jgi:hypothetical protein
MQFPMLSFASCILSPGSNRVSCGPSGDSVARRDWAWDVHDNEVMKKLIICSLAVGGIFVSRSLVFAEHDKACKNVHGKVTVISEDGVTVNDKLYKVGKSTRLTKGDRVVKLENLSAGDMVCLDTRGKDDIGGSEVASVAVLTLNDSAPVREKEYVREKETVRQISHDKSCNHLHGKVTRIDDSTIIVEGKPHAYTTTTVITKDGQTQKIETIKTGDFVCLDEQDAKVTSVVVLSPTEATPFQSREIIREKVREEK